MKTVRNISTGKIHTVNDDHFSVTSKEYELVMEKKATQKRKPRKKAVSK